MISSASTRGSSFACATSGRVADLVPSGVSRSTPYLRTFTSNEEALTFSLRFSDDPPFNATPDALARTYARFQSYGAVAERRTADVVKYMNTPVVARDMLAIVQAHGREKLLYWGISYGSVLGRCSSSLGAVEADHAAGLTYASLFPNNVGRLVVDGIVDPRVFYATQWTDMLVCVSRALPLSPSR
jgi:pimeloyl-ACP methyl ester carboxylesterase